MLKKRISSIVTVVILGAFALYFFNNIEAFEPLLEVSFVTIAFLSIAKVLKFVSNGVFIQWTIEVFTKKFSLRESIYVAILSAVGNFFGPLFGGAAVRAVYLKKVHKLSYSFFLSTLAGYYVILFGIFSLLGAVSVFFAPESTQRSTLLVFFLVWFGVMVLLAFFRLPNRKRLQFFDQYKIAKYVITVVYDIDKGWSEIVKRKRLLVQLTGLGISNLLITALATFVAFQAIGADISLAGLGLHTALASTSILLSVTPGAIGIKEGLLVLNASVMGVSSDQVLQVAIIDRAISFFVICGLYLVSKRLKVKTITKS